MHLYQLSEAEQAIASTAATIAQDVALRHAPEVDTKGRFPRETLTALGAQGYLGLTVPADFGGQGQGPRVFAAAVEELAQGCASAAMVYVMHVAATQAIAASNLLDGPRRPARGNRRRPPSHHPGPLRARLPVPLLGPDFPAHRRRRLQLHHQRL